jgi:hypothetical protein
MFLDKYNAWRRNLLPPSKNDLDWRFGTLFRGIADVIGRGRQTAGYAARAEIGAILNCLAGDPKRLENYGFKVYSQSDEDGIIEEIFRRLGIEKGRFCEIGVENGLECNSLYLIHKGWKGVWIEGNKDQKARIENKFASIMRKRLDLVISFVTRENINDLMRQNGVGPDIDFLSIDIDGNDIYVLDAIEIRPKVICVEYNAKFPASLSKQQAYNPNHVWKGTDYFGSSLRALTEAADKKGYVLVGTNITGANAFFVRKELAEGLFTEAGQVDRLYNPPRYWLISDHYQYIGHPADFGSYVDLE